MDLPASYYGKLDKKNPVISSFERDISSFTALMRRAASSFGQDKSHAKGIKILTEIWRNYKHRLPPKFYQERMLQVADFLYGLKLYQVALWQGYSLHLRHFSSVKITDITDVDHFMACFFPGGFDTDQDILGMKIRAMLGCALCIFELEKRHSVLSQKGLSKLLHVLNFIRILMQACQQHDHLCWHLYNGSLHIYSICRYLMTVNCSAQALEYLLWASISLELSIPLMTPENLSWLVTLYCAVCHCYYDNQAAVQAEEFARRALGKVNDLAELEKESGVPPSRETQITFKEATIKLAAMIFKHAVFQGRRKTKPSRIKSAQVRVPRTTTEHILMSLFDSSAAQFLAILEALWDSSAHPLQMRAPDEPEVQEVVRELLSAGISILTGASSSDDHNRVSFNTSTSTLMDLAITGENKVHITSAVRFLKLLFHYKQQDVFSKLARQMLQVLSGVEGHSFKKAELELALLDRFNSLQSSQKSCTREDPINNERCKSSFLKSSEEFTGLVDILHKSVCGFAPEVQPDGDLVWDIVVYLWDHLKAVMPKVKPKNLDLHNLDKFVWCLSMLCEVVFVCELANLDCILTAEMIHSLATLLESAAELSKQARSPGDKDCDGVKPSSFSLLEKSRSELLQMECEVVEKGLKALSKSVATLLPQGSSSVIDFAFMQKFGAITSASSPMSEEGYREHKTNRTGGEVENKVESDEKSAPHIQAVYVSQLATDLLHELDIIHHRASVKLLHLNAVAESELWDRIKENKVSKALLLIQKALLVYNNMEPNNSSKTKSLLEEASTLIEKAGMEEKKLYMSNDPKTPAEDKVKTEEKENPPPPPILVSRTNCSFIFIPAPYHMEEQVCWYQLFGRAAEGINNKVRLRDCSLQGTGDLVPAVSGECMLKVEGLESNHKYVFAVAAYNSQGMLVGSTIGGTTLPLLACMPLPLLSSWAHLAQVAFQTEQYVIAKTACRELWSHYTSSGTGSNNPQSRLATTELHVQTLRCSSPLLCQLFLTSIFIETQINIQQASLYCDSGMGLFIWEQEARLAECERMLVAMDLAMWLNDSSAAVQAVVSCYGLLVPLIFHQIPCYPVAQVLTKCLIVLEENSVFLKQKLPGNTSESLMHMLACLTYYLSKALRVLKDHQIAAVVMDCGRALLQDIYNAQQKTSKSANKPSRTVHPAAVKTELKRSPQLKALNVKSKKMITLDRTHSAGNEILCPRSGPEDPSMFYDQISSGTLKDASQYVMKLGRKACFIECAALLLLRAMEEGQPDFVLKSGQAIFEVLSRRDEAVGLTTKCLEGNYQGERKTHVQSLKTNEPLQNKNASSKDPKKFKQKIPRSMLRRVSTTRERLAVEKMLTSMSSIVQRHKKQLQLRSMCFEESVWRASLNYSLAQAHLLLYYQGLDQQLGGVLQDRYSQINPVSFSLAYSGVLVQWRSSQWQRSYKYGVASEIDSSHSGVHDYEISVHKSRNTKAAPDDSYPDNSCEETDDISQSDEQQYEMHGHHPALLLDSLKKAALHLRRAMVLAHRGSHWTTLQSVCQTVWEQSSRLVELEERVSHFKPSFLNTAEQLHNIFAPLLVLATDLVMDMLNRLELWSLYDKLTEEELESSLHFSAPLDESTRVDLRWVCTLVLHTLEILHDNGKWESLAHFALLFNSYTRERYTLAVTPLLVVAQRKLLVRIGAFGGPTVPQPHHSKTQRATGMEVAYRSYAGCKLLSGWTPHPAQQPETPLTPRDITELRDAEMKHSLSLVRVPLVVEDTLCHYRKALERRPHCLQVFQHSRSLLLLLLAYTQPCFAAQLQLCKSRSLLSSSVVGFSPIVMTAPEIRPCDLTEENYSTPNSLYSLPISPDHVPKITAAYTTTIKYLQANNHESLHILALHEMGNLQFYDRNTGAAHSYWSKALDTALQSSGVLEKWDGVSLGGGTFQQTLKQAGLWRCLQAAGLSAKIAQYTLTSDISQRTRCCLLSAYLFKCVLCCSLARPQADLQYSSYCIGDELLPGVDLFSAPHRVHLGTTVAGLNFICQWLFITGYHMTLLPMLALYLHFVGSVCRDMQRTVEARILKIRALTELCLFTEAIKETLQLTQGTGVPLPNEPTQDNLQPVKMFCSNKSLWDNTEALEELVNCEFAPEVSSLYGSTLQLRFHLARIQLVLALSSTVHGHPVPACSVNSELHEQDKLDPEDSCHEKQKTKVLVLDSDKEKTTPERIKFLLLEGAAVLLNSLDLTSQSHGKTETLELTIQSNLLKANLYLQQGQAAHSSEMAASCLALLQSSPLVMRRSIPGSGELAAELPPVRTTTEQGTKDHSESDPLHGDCPREVEASERIGGALWLHCRMALFRSLAAQIHDTAVRFPGKNITEVAAEVLQQGLHECARLGEVDIQSLLMVEGAELQALRGRSDDSMALLQEAVCLLSGQTCMPPGSSVTLARATLLLSHLRETQSAVLLKLTQKVLQKQLWDFGVNVVLVDGKMCLSPPGLSNIYLPYLHILEQTTLQKGQG